jgi:hypothetical protein
MVMNMILVWMMSQCNVYVIPESIRRKDLGYESILDGHFTVAKNGLPVRLIFQRNHPSWEDNTEAQDVLISVLSEWFNAGSLEYVERLHRLPHCILAIGRVPKNTAPFHRIVTEQQICGKLVGEVRHCR